MNEKVDLGDDRAKGVKRAFEDSEGPVGPGREGKDKAGPRGRERVRALLLPRYSADQASSRQRFFAPIPGLASRGMECVIEPFFDTGFLRRRFSGRLRLGIEGLRSFSRRIKVLRRLGKIDVLYVQMELLPYLPGTIELALLRDGPPMVLDLDDAWFERYRRHESVWVRRCLGEKIQDLLCAARNVVVGSEYLREFALRYNHQVTLIPTGLDVFGTPTAGSSRPRDAAVCVGWIGSPTTAEHLGLVEGVLRQMKSEGAVSVIIVGAGAAGDRYEFAERYEWSPETEREALGRMDVGIMPLRSDEFSRGKCAFKLIQYMAAGKPVIASPVGENELIVRPGINGYLAADEKEWRDALERLRRAPEGREQMGREGRRIAEATYDLSVLVPRLHEVLVAAASSRHAGC